MLHSLYLGSYHIDKILRPFSKHTQAKKEQKELQKRKALYQSRNYNVKIFKVDNLMIVNFICEFKDEESILLLDEGLLISWYRPNKASDFSVRCFCQNQTTLDRIIPNTYQLSFGQFEQRKSWQQLPQPSPAETISLF